jgi:hypothetical protein
MKYYILIFLFFPYFLVFSQDKNIKINNELSNYDFYMCDNQDLDNLINKRYQLLKFMDYQTFDIEYINDKNTLEISEGISISTIKDCIINVTNENIIITGFYDQQNDTNDTIKDIFYIIIFKNYAIYYSSYNHVYKYLFKIEKSISFLNKIKDSYKEFWFNKYSNYNCIGFKWNEKEVFINNQKYNYLIYPVLKKEGKKFIQLNNVLGIYILNTEKNNFNYFLLEIKGKDLKINTETNYSLVKEGFFYVDE